jgi:hypothetical protein
MAIDILRTGTLLFGYKSLSELPFAVILNCETTFKLRGIPARKAFCFLHLSELFKQFFILFHAHIHYFLNFFNLL